MRLTIVVLLALVLISVAGTANARPDLPDPIWILKCIGDSLNGAACHGSP